MTASEIKEQLSKLKRGFQNPFGMIWDILAFTFLACSLIVPVGGIFDPVYLSTWDSAILMVILAMGVSLWRALSQTRGIICGMIVLVCAFGVALLPLQLTWMQLVEYGPMATGLWCLLIGGFLLFVRGLRMINYEVPTHFHEGISSSITHLAFGLSILYFWQVMAEASQWPRMIIPTPLDIFMAAQAMHYELWKAFKYTVFVQTLPAYLIGLSFGLCVALWIGLASARVSAHLRLISRETSWLPLLGLAPLFLVSVPKAEIYFPAFVTFTATVAFFPTPAVKANQLHEHLNLARLFRSIKQPFILCLSAVVALQYFPEPDANLENLFPLIEKMYSSRTPEIGIGDIILREMYNMNTDVAMAAFAMLVLAGWFFYIFVSLLEEWAVLHAQRTQERRKQAEKEEKKSMPRPPQTVVDIKPDQN